MGVRTYFPEKKIQTDSLSFDTMGDRRSNSSSEGTVEEAKVGIKGDFKTLIQVSSSGRAAQERRGEKAAASLDSAMKNFQSLNHAQSGGGSSSQQGSGKK